MGGRMKIWVTGARGLVGSVFYEEFSPLCVGTGREVDIADRNQVDAFLQQHPEISHIVNCAAYSLVDGAEKEPHIAHLANAIGPENLAKAAKERGLRLLHISTDYIFDGKKGSPYKEEDVPFPLNAYGKSKLEGEQRVLSSHPGATIVRTSWVFGRGGKNFVAKLLQMLQDVAEIYLSHDQVGRPTYAVDLAQALFLLLEKEGIYQFANQGEATKFSFGCFLRDLQGRSDVQIFQVPSSHFPFVCHRPPYSVLSTEKVAPLLPRPIRPWQEALAEFLRIPREKKNFC